MPLFEEPILQVGDRVRIVCPEVPELCVDRRVGPDGTVDLPRVGPLAGVLRPASELAKKIEARLRNGLLPVRVEVRRLGPAPDEATIQGSVSRPLRVYAPRGIDFDRLFTAAGPLPESDRLLVNPPGRLRPGTSVFMPALTVERRVSVLGGVNGPCALAPSRGMTLGRAIESAGGLTGHGDPNAIVVMRGVESLPLQMPGDAEFPLEAGDLVQVGLRADRHYVIVKGLVARAGSVEYAPGMTATRALSVAGGLLPAASAGTLVWQTGPKTFRLSIGFLLSHRIPDPVIGPEDTLIVEAAKP